PRSSRLPSTPPDRQARPEPTGRPPGRQRRSVVIAAARPPLAPPPLAPPPSTRRPRPAAVAPVRKPASSCPGWVRRVRKTNPGGKETTMSERDGYIPGVPCWIDTSQPDPDAAVAFYGGLFGWDLEDTMPAGSESKYFIGRIRGGDVAAVSSAPAG